jgi:hypothetical protein
VHGLATVNLGLFRILTKSVPPKGAVERLAFLLCIQNVLNPDAMYIDWGLSWLYSVPPGKFRHSIINQSMTTSFQILPKVSSRYLYTHLVTSDIWTGTSDNLFTKDNRDSRVRGDTGQDTTAKPCRITWDSTVMSHFQNLTGFPLKYALNCVTQ